MIERILTNLLHKSNTVSNLLVNEINNISIDRLIRRISIRFLHKSNTVLIGGQASCRRRCRSPGFVLRRRDPASIQIDRATILAGGRLYTSGCYDLFITSVQLHHTRSNHSWSLDHVVLSFTKERLDVWFRNGWENSPKKRLSLKMLPSWINSPQMQNCQSEFVLPYDRWGDRKRRYEPYRRGEIWFLFPKGLSYLCFVAKIHQRRVGLW